MPEGWLLLTGVEGEMLLFDLHTAVDTLKGIEKPSKPEKRKGRGFLKFSRRKP